MYTLAPFATRVCVIMSPMPEPPPKNGMKCLACNYPLARGLVGIESVKKPGLLVGKLHSPVTRATRSLQSNRCSLVKLLLAGLLEDILTAWKGLDARLCDGFCDGKLITAGGRRCAMNEELITAEAELDNVLLVYVFATRRTSGKVMTSIFFTR